MLFVRADSNPTISGGHIMRCLAIANELADRGEQVCFLVADDDPVPVLEEAGVPYIVLRSDWRDPMTDAEQVKGLLEKDSHPVLLIDTYQVTREYVEKLKPYCRIAYLGSKKEYLGQLDLLINYSMATDHEFYRKNYDERTVLLLGPRYAPLRKEFRNAVREYRDRVERILITTGNTDHDNMVSAVIEGLRPIAAGTGIRLDVVVGRMFGHKKELHEAYDNEPDIILHENVKSMSALMKDCDMAVSANGTTVYELSAMGLPTISFAMAEEQTKSAEAMSEAAAVDYCGRSFEDKDRCVARIVSRVSYYLADNNRLIELAERAHALIGGNGVFLIANALCSL